MDPAEIGVLFDAHDALVRDCIEGGITFLEFVAAYGDFPYGYLPEDPTSSSEEERVVLRLFRKRIAFHRRVAGVLSGLRSAREAGALEGGVGGFMAAAGLMRLRELLARHPQFEAVGETGRCLGRLRDVPSTS